MPPSSRRLVIACGLMAAAAAAIMPATAASAVAAPVYWVSPSGASASANTSCATAGFSKVQAAVTAAETYESQHPGTVPVVDVCPGTYAEQVTILKSLTVTASRGATIELPASVGTDQLTGLSATNCQANDGANRVQTPQSVLEVCAAKAGGGNTSGVKVTVSGLTIEGNWPGSVCYDSLYGVLVEGGASLTMTGSTVEKAGAVSPLSGCQGGVGIEVGDSSTSEVGHATLSRDTIESYQKNGITADGDGSTAAISDVTVAGAGATKATAQNGIQISDGATGSVTGSSVTGNNYTGAGGTEATGILVFGGCGDSLDKNVSVTRNTLNGNDIGIGLFNYDPACAKSTSTPTRDEACWNVIKNSNGYPGGTPSADANVTGWTNSNPVVGYQAGVSDVGRDDVICGNAISGPGYAPLGTTSSLPHPAPPAFVRPIDTVSTPDTTPSVFTNTYDGKQYLPS